MYCKKCGTKLLDDAAFCENCGTAVYAPAAPATPVQAPATNNQSVPKKKGGLKVALIIILVVVFVALAAIATLLITGAIGRNTPPVPALLTDEPDTQAQADLPEQDEQEPPEQTAAPETNYVTNQNISLELAICSADGVYTGTVDESGLPHGDGRFETESDSDGDAWSYQGGWEHGHLAGQGEMIMATGWTMRGEFLNDDLNGHGTMEQGGILRYEGEWVDGKLEGYGKLYTPTGKLMYEGEFVGSQLNEDPEAREMRAAAFMEDCIDMDEMFYASWKDGYDVLDTPLALWGEVAALTEQTSHGIVIINLFGDENYPVALQYRYNVDERRMTGDEGSIAAWGYCVGEEEYGDDDAPDTVPLVEVIYWIAE